MIFIWIFIFIIQTIFLFLFIIAILNRLFFNFIIILEWNNMRAKGAKALAEALKLNKNLITIDLGKFMRLLTYYYNYLIIIAKFSIFHFKK